MQDCKLEREIQTNWKTEMKYFSVSLVQGEVADVAWWAVRRPIDWLT